MTTIAQTHSKGSDIPRYSLYSPIDITTLPAIVALLLQRGGKTNG